jgi:hypothetical protein
MIVVMALHAVARPIYLHTLLPPCDDRAHTGLGSDRPYYVNTMIGHLGSQTLGDPPGEQLSIGWVTRTQRR